MPTAHDAYDKLGAAIHTLATHPGLIRQRIDAALGDVAAAGLTRPFPSTDMEALWAWISATARDLEHRDDSELSTFVACVLQLQSLLEDYLRWVR